MNLEQFFETVITSDSGWLCVTTIPAGLANTKEGQGKYKQHWFGWPDDKDSALKFIYTNRKDFDVYFSPYLFRTKQSTKENTLPTRTIVADLDEANVLTIPVKPSVLVETSDNRHQGYWILREPEDKLEQYAQRLTYSIPRCDPGGWFIGKFLRVPETFNYKYKSGPRHVTIISSDGSTQYRGMDFDYLPSIEKSIGTKVEYSDNFDWADEALLSDIGPQELLATIRTKLPPRVVATYDIESEDRSGALWGLMVNAFRAGCSKEQVFFLGYHSANNKFADLKSGGRRELAKDVLRAQAEVRHPSADIRSRIMEVRRTRGLQVEKKTYIAEAIKEAMVKDGQFIHCNDGTLWYIREDIGKPVSLTMRSPTLDTMLDSAFGINSTEAECNFVKAHLITFVSELPQSGTISSLSYYDTETRKLFVHTGRREVLQVTKESMTKVVNGENGIIFKWSPHARVLDPDKGRLDQPWYEEVFGDCLDNLTGMNRDEAMALLRIWTIMVIMRNTVVSRPILTLLGQPGAGKSTLFRRVYLLLYGEQRSLNAITSPDDFDFAVANDPLVVFDNVDTWERWLPDRLALSVTVSEFTRRRLYTDNDTITTRRQAILGLTAHNPKFGREDVADRLLILNFERLKEFKPETAILDRIMQLRNKLWGEIVSDIQLVLAQPMPTNEEIPQFRVEDFARVGYWVAKALGIEDTFSSVMRTLRKEQRMFSLEEDQLLIESLLDVTSKMKAEQLQDFRAPGAWWTRLEMASKDPLQFKKQYGSAQKLAKKLWAMQEPLREIFTVDWQYIAGSRHWRFLPLESKE